MATFAKVDTFIDNLCQGNYNLAAAEYSFFLTNTAHTQTWDNISDLTACTGAANVTDKTLTKTSASATDGEFTLVLQDKTSPASGAVGPFQYVYIHERSTGWLVGYYDFASAQTLSNGQNLIIDFTDAGQIFISVS